MVVLFDRLIFFIKREDIEIKNQVEKIMEYLFDEDSTNLSINYAQIEVDILNLDEMFDEIQVRMGVRIDVALAGSECFRENMI